MKISRIALVPAVALLAACAENAVAPLEGPAALDPTHHVVTQLECQVNVRGGSMTCAQDAAGGAARNLIYGGQNQYVRLTSSGVAYDTTARRFSANVDLQNLLAQPIGTLDGVNNSDEGTRVFFYTGPTVTSGTGVVTVANASGSLAFTGTQPQPYFQYDCLLAANESYSDNCGEGPYNWQWNVPSTVNTFVFTLLVDATVQYPDGYVSIPTTILEPSSTTALAARVLDGYGNDVGGTISGWTSSDTAIARVDASGKVTTGATQGYTRISAQSGTRSGSATVVVCHIVNVALGDSVSAAIGNNDCPGFRDGSFAVPSEGFAADYYSLSLAAGQRVTITLDTGNELDSYLILFGPAGNVIDSNDDASGDLGVGSQVTITAPTAGVYHIEATTYSQGEAGSYTLRVQDTSL